MCNEKKPIFIGNNNALGEFKVFETSNKARKYIVSEKFGMMNMQGKVFQEKIKTLIEVVIEEKPKEEKTGFWGFRR